MQAVNSLGSGASRRKFDRKGLSFDDSVSAVFLTCAQRAKISFMMDIQKHMRGILFFLCFILVFPHFAFAATTLSQTSSVPALSDETATYSFTSSAAGTIVYSGTCGNADKSSAIAGENRVTWTLTNGVYSNCTIAVNSSGSTSNTLAVPKFESTSKYPVVFVHGLGGTGSSAWNTAKSYLTGQGWKAELLVANSITESNSTLCGTASPKQTQEVAGWIDAVLAKYPGFDKVDLIGHSRGGSNIMRGLWHGYINVSKIRQVVTMSGANRDCSPYYPAIPSDETPGDIRYSVYYSDGSPDNDPAVDLTNTNVTGAYNENLNPLSHAEMKTASTALAAMKKSLTGEVGSSPPVTAVKAVITTTNQQGLAPLTLSFDGTKSTGSISSYKWTFGDGSSATGATASHTYQLSGTFTTTLTVANTSGQSHQSSVTITATPPLTTAPTAVISSSNAVGVAPFAVQFDGSGSVTAQPPITSYSWTFGDGAVAQGAKVSHTFSVAGTYNTTLTVTDSAGKTAQKSTPVVISAVSNPVNQKPVSTFTATALSGNAPLTVSFDGSGSKDPDGTIKTYTWNFGNGSTVSGVSATQTYTEAGNYTVSLQVADDKGATAISTKTISVLSAQAIGFELLEVQANQNWAKVTFTKPFVNPIVVAGPPAFADAAPAIIRMRNITSTGFEVRVQEWSYLDDQHSAEKVSFIVMEKGIYTLGNGTKIEAGSFIGSTSFKKIALQQSYAQIPVVLTQVATYAEVDAVTGRIRNGNQTSFEYSMQEQEKNAISHIAETIGYIAWQPGKGEYAGLLYEAGLTTKSVTQNWFSLAFQTKFSLAPFFIAGMQTSAESDTAALRYQKMSQTGIQVKVEEERSNGYETRHAAETVGYLSIIALP